MLDMARNPCCLTLAVDWRRHLAILAVSTSSVHEVQKSVSFPRLARDAAAAALVL